MATILDNDLEGVSVDSKLCGKCKETLPLTSFYKQAKGTKGRQAFCKTCKSKQDRDHKIKPGFYERERDRHLLSRYGITHKEYLEMVTKQKGLCAMCHSPETKRSEHGRLLLLCVDHCHTTGEIRGLLCNQCNKGLGLFKDSISLLKSGISYLEKFNG